MQRGMSKYVKEKKKKLSLEYRTGTIILDEKTSTIDLSNKNSLFFYWCTTILQAM
jgi:hypothetical protein